MTRFGRINLKYSTNLWRPAGLGRAQSQSQPFHSSSFIRVPSHASVSSLPLPGPRRDGSRAPVTALTIAGSDEPPSALLRDWLAATQCARTQGCYLLAI